MVAMQMTDKNHRKTVAGQSGPLERRQNARAAIEQKARLTAFDQVATGQTPTGAESIAAAKDCQTHDASMYWLIENIIKVTSIAKLARLPSLKGRGQIFITRHSKDHHNG
jgi:hypothetical protein